MSSLAAARADNFYHGPDYDPAQHGSLNKYRGSHGALGARANKLDQGILVIRFEVPFHLWCAKCGDKVAKGERFNAEKKQIGNYHSTKIWEFRMTHHCGSLIIITTDPKNAQYCVVEGARQKVESYTAEDAEVLELQDQEERDRLRNDPLYRLEHGERVKKEARTAAQQLSDLQELNHDLHADPYALNKRLRAQLRAAKKESAALDARRDALNLPESLQLLPEEEGDKVEAQIAFLSADDRGRHPRSRTAILSQSIFSSSAKKHKSNSRSSSQPVAPLLPTAAAAAAAAASAGRGPGLGSGPSGSGSGVGFGLGVKAKPTSLLSAPQITGRSGQATAAGQHQHEQQQQQQQQQQRRQQAASHQQRHHLHLSHASQAEAEAGRAGEGVEGVGVLEPPGAGVLAAAPTSAHKASSLVSKPPPSSCTAAAAPKGPGAGALAAAPTSASRPGPSSAASTKGPGAGALAAAPMAAAPSSAASTKGPGAGALAAAPMAAAPSSAAASKGPGAGALAAAPTSVHTASSWLPSLPSPAPSSAAASKGPGAGALAAAAARGLKWKPKAGTTGSGHPNSHLGGKANGHKGAGQWGRSGHAGGQAGAAAAAGAGAGAGAAAGAKRSLMGKAELLAKRQKLEGLKLGLGGMK